MSAAASAGTGAEPERVFAGRVITPERAIDDGVVAVSGGLITYVGARAAAPERVRQAVDRAPSLAPDALVLPGLVDIHNHGGGGASIPDAEHAGDVRTAVAEHRRHGTTRMLASLVTQPTELLRERTAMLADLAEEGVIAGIHFEGPFISHARCGAQNPAFIIPGDPDLARDLLRIGRGHVRTMTVAPETERLLGSGGVMAALVDAGAVPSFGHTDAGDEVMRAALEEAVVMLAGTGRMATVTHLFNGMRPLHHRAPGPVPPALAAGAEGQAVLELIGDGVHVSPSLVADLVRIVGGANIALITDAMAAAGMSDGAYRLGSLDVEVSGGVARLAGGESIAGGTAHLLDVVRTCVAAGVPLVTAVASASAVPAAVIDPQARFGALRVGHVGDVLVTDGSLRVLDVSAQP